MASTKFELFELLKESVHSTVLWKTFARAAGFVLYTSHWTEETERKYNKYND